MMQVLHYDEICLHSNRWHRNIRALPTLADRDQKGKRRAAGGTVFGLGTAATQCDSPGEVMPVCVDCT